MNRGLYCIILIVVCMSLLSASIFSDNARFIADKYDLIYKFKKDQQFVISSTSTVINNVEAMGQRMVTKINTKRKCLFTVKSIDDNGNTNFEVEYLEMKQTMDNPMAGKMDMDYSELIGKKVNIVLAPTGKIIEFKDFEKLPEISMGMRGNMTKDQYIQPFRTLFPILTGKLTEIGKSWTDNIEYDEKQASSDRNVETESTYTLLEKVEKNGREVLKINRKTKVSISGTAQQMGNDMTLTFEGEGEGTIYFDLEKGMFKDAVSDNSMSGTISMTGQGMVMPSVISSKDSVSVEFK